MDFPLLGIIKGQDSVLPFLFKHIEAVRCFSRLCFRINAIDYSNYKNISGNRPV